MIAAAAAPAALHFAAFFTTSMRNPNTRAA
jgi:hypothetical protein